MNPGVLGAPVSPGSGVSALRHEPPCPRVGAVVEQEPVDVLVPGVLVPGDVLEPLVIVIQGEVRLLLGQQLVQGLTVSLLFVRGAEPDSGRPPLRRHDAAVQRVVPRSPAQRVGGVQHLVVVEVGGLMASFVGHRSAPLGRAC